jgi:hypothetical protein
LALLPTFILDLGPEGDVVGRNRLALLISNLRLEISILSRKDLDHVLP